MRFWLGKLIGFVLGILLGIAFLLVPAVIVRLLHPNTWAGDAHALGTRAGFAYGLIVPTLLSIVIGLFLGVIGQAWGGRLQEAAYEKSARLAAAARQAQQAGDVWPPPPDRGDTDDT